MFQESLKKKKVISKEKYKLRTKRSKGSIAYKYWLYDVIYSIEFIFSCINDGGRPHWSG